MADMLPTIPDGEPLILREKIIQYIMTSLEGLYRTDPTGDKLFKHVFRGDPDDEDNGDKYGYPAVWVEDGDEEKGSDMTQQVVHKTMIVYVHLRYDKGQGGVDPYKIFNYYLGRVVKMILEDNRLGGNCFDCNEVGSSPKVFTQDRSQGGTLVLAVRYRHVRNDLYTQR